MTGISPPPWRFERENRLIYDASKNVPIFRAVWIREADANGALVVAAPDLQAALRELVARIDTLLAGAVLAEIDLEPELTAARAALARFGGEP